MTAIAALHQSTAAETVLASIEQVAYVDRADQLAQRVVAVAALVDEPVDPSAIAPAALVLRAEGLVDLPGITFGCNYDLDVLSFELSRGYTRAIDAGWLTLRSRRVSVNPSFARGANSEACDRARELFALGRPELMRAARHHLLREAAD